MKLDTERYIELIGIEKRLKKRIEETKDNVYDQTVWNELQKILGEKKE